MNRMDSRSFIGIGFSGGRNSATNGFLLRQRPFPKPRFVHDHEVSFEFTAGLEQGGKKSARRVGAIGPHPEQDYRRWRGESPSEDQLTLVAIERDDPALFGDRLREYFGVRESPTTFGD